MSLRSQNNLKNNYVLELDSFVKYLIEELSNKQNNNILNVCYWNRIKILTITNLKCSIIKFKFYITLTNWKF